MPMLKNTRHEAFAQNIAKGLTQEACASKADITQVYWSTLENGHRGTRTDEIALLKAMCKAVGLKMTVIIEEV